jgi:hypothetical protein
MQGDMCHENNNKNAVSAIVTASVVKWSEFQVTDPEFDSRRY